MGDKEEVPEQKQWAPFNVKDAVVLITGGSSGIGLQLAKEFKKAGAAVIVTGRSEDRLQAADDKLEGVTYYVNDVADQKQREELHALVTKEHPGVNVLINNAGNQRRVSLPDDSNWPEREAEIQLNMSAPIHLTWLFTPHFKTKKEAAIINLTSALGYWPSPWAVTYGATKAAMSHWTVSARYSYPSNIRLVELIPPSVKSNLGGSHDYGLDTEEFAREAFKQFAAGKLEIGVEKAANLPVWEEGSADRKTIRRTGLTAAKMQEFKTY